MTWTHKDLSDENDRLRKALESVQHEATSLRVWAGSAWVYHPPQVARIARACAAALDRQCTCSPEDNPPQPCRVERGA